MSVLYQKRGSFDKREGSPVLVYIIQRRRCTENREIVLSSVLLESPAHLRPVGTSHPAPLQPAQEPRHRTGRSTAQKRNTPQRGASGLLYPCLPTAAGLDGAACLLRRLSREPKQGDTTCRVCPDGIVEAIGYDK